MARLRAEPPPTRRRGRGRAGRRPGRGDGGLPPTDGLRYHLADGSRVIVRPSGTEPKLKVYLEVIEPVAGRPGTLATARARRGRAGWPASAASMAELTAL